MSALPNPQAIHPKLKSIKKSFAKSFANKIAQKWTNAPEVVCFSGLSDPAIAHIKSELLKKSASESEIDGFYYNNRVYINTDNVYEEKTVLSTILHEVVGHFGIRQTFGKDLESVLRLVIESQPDAVRLKAADYNLPKTEQGMLEAAEEVLAEMAEDDKELGIVNRSIVNIRGWLRNHFPGQKCLRFSRDEIIRNFILPAKQFVINGGTKQNTLQTISSKFKKWFGQSKVVDACGEPKIMYHGTYADFSVFKLRIGDIGLHFGDAATASDRVATAVPHRGNKNGKSLSANVMPLYLSIQNPLRLPDVGFWNAENLKGQLLKLFPEDAKIIGSEWSLHSGLKSTKDIREYLQSKGYDGVVYKNTGEVEGSAPFRESIAAAKLELQKVFPIGKNSYSPEDQKNPAFIRWSEAERAYREHREKNGTDSFIAFHPSQVKSALCNNGDFDHRNKDIRFRRTAAQSKFEIWTQGLPVISQSFTQEHPQREYEGGPGVFVAYHGTTHTDITEFKRVGNSEGFLGKGPYFTTSFEDANQNYAGFGVDLKNRIQLEAESIESNIDNYGMRELLKDYFEHNDYDEAIDLETLDDEAIEDIFHEHGTKASEWEATRRLAGESMGLVMKVYVRVSKPADTTGKGLTPDLYCDFDDENTGPRPGRELSSWLEASRSVANDFDFNPDEYVGACMSHVMDYGQIGMDELFKLTRKHFEFCYDDNGELQSGGAIFSEIAKKAGYDGIIMDADLHFGSGRRGFGGVKMGQMNGVQRDTLHIVPFSPEQVKSFYGNNGNFSLDNPDVRLRRTSRQKATE